MVGMLAAAGALDQIGRPTAGSGARSRDPAVAAAARGAHPRAATRCRRSAESTFGRIGGRSMGMYTAVSNPDQWMRQFGVDVEEIDQREIVRRSAEVDRRRVDGRARVARAARRRRPLRRRPADARAARAPDPLLLRDARADRRVESRLLRHQGPARADRPLRDDGRHRGVPQRPLRLGRAQGDARLRDRGRHGRRADDADPQAAVGGTPVLFADVRHYHADLDIWDLCNSGQHATWFAARSDDPPRTCASVHLYPEDFYFPRRRRLGPPPRRARRRSRSRG